MKASSLRHLGSFHKSWYNCRFTPIEIQLLTIDNPAYNDKTKSKWPHDALLI